MDKAREAYVLLQRAQHQSCVLLRHFQREGESNLFFLNENSPTTANNKLSGMIGSRNL